MKLTSMRYIGHLPNRTYPFPTLVKFDNGNTRVIHDETDCELLEKLLTQVNIKKD